ncbi:MAG TPA: SDR family oxidoreductase [Polyangiales bacterium]|nr:SDR family oxidoreductase [Polyangiales bacterium]
MKKSCEGRVVIVTGAGRGIGREHALAFARAGASVVVNDLGTSASGESAASVPAEEVVAEIGAFGGRAIANADDVADFEAARRLVASTIDAFGGLDVVVNNAGFVRDRMFATSGEAEWDAVLRVHLKGHFCVTRHACEYWRERAKAGHAVDARIINTSSGAGLLGSVGQSAYSAAKGGILALTLVQAAELASYGVTANAIAPAARTRMTESTFAEMMKKPDAGFDVMDPANIAPLVVWLGSSASRHVTGRVFELSGGAICLYQGHHPGPSVQKGARWDVDELGDVVADLLARAPEALPVYGQK